MSDINTLTTLAYVKASMAFDKAKDKIRSGLSSFSNDERGVDGIVVSLILIGLAAVAALIFRKALFGEDGNGGIIGDVIGKIKNIFENSDGDGGFSNGGDSGPGGDKGMLFYLPF